jgi:histidinol phosphatase-like enzyme
MPVGDQADIRARKACTVCCEKTIAPAEQYNNKYKFDVETKRLNCECRRPQPILVSKACHKYIPKNTNPNKVTNYKDIARSCNACCINRVGKDGKKIVSFYTGKSEWKLSSRKPGYNQLYCECSNEPPPYSLPKNELIPRFNKSIRIT